MVPKNKTIAAKLKIVERIVHELRVQLGSDLRAVGLSGSVARGTAEEYSDIDFLVILKQPHPELPLFQIIENTYCSLLYETRDSINEQLKTPNHELPEILGGLTKLLPLYDPGKILPKIEEKANKVPEKLFRKCAELALIHSYEDFCRTKNAYLREDEIVLKDNVLNVTISAANIVAALNNAHFDSDREIFKAHKRLRKLPKGFNRIEDLRYGDLHGKKLFEEIIDFYVNLVDFCLKEGIKFPVPEDVLKRV